MRYLILVAVLLSASQTWASEVTVIEAWARATAPGQGNGAVYFRIVSQQDARIFSVTSPAAASAEMHSMTHENDVMKMRALESVLLPARQAVELGSGGSHIMLIGLKQPLKVGDSVPLVLTIQFTDKSKEKVEVKAEVRPFTSDSGKHERRQGH